tara:strand:- start:316 stop:453 length:138 start_codon:yes stop_codon:yes gene_type:complete
MSVLAFESQDLKVKTGTGKTTSDKVGGIHDLRNQITDNSNRREND